MAHHARELSARLCDFVGAGGFDNSPVERARQAILVRHRRKGYFDHDLFMDPAWQILLHLFVAQEEQAPVSIAACCAAAGVPEAAAVRWIDVLEDRGLVTISDRSSADHRCFVRLTDPAHHAMHDFWLEQDPI